MPQAISGNFASVYKITGTDGRKWAVKCFTRRVADRDLRYRRIIEALATRDFPWKVGLEYLPTGVLCGDGRFPLLKMEWVDGQGLLQYVDAHWQEPDRMVAIAGQFAKIATDLKDAGIAHGDLQHGNVLVADDGQLRLVDYDGMYVPRLKSLGATEVGHPNYQSPRRTMGDWGPHLDNFSAWLIYASLAAVAIEPSLWPRLHTDGEEALLLRRADFEQHRRSLPLSELARSDNAGLAAIARAVTIMCGQDLRDLPSLDPTAAAVCEHFWRPAVRQATVKGRSPSEAKIALAPPASDGGDRSFNAPSGGEAAPGSTAGLSAWMSDHLPARPAVEFSGSRRGLRVVTVVSALATVGLGILAWPAALGGPALYLVAGYALYRSSSERRATAKWRRSLSHKEGERDRERRRLSSLMKRREKAARREREAAGKLSRRLVGDQTDEQNHQSAADQAAAARLVAVTAQREAVQARERAEIEAALQLLRLMQLRTELNAHRISRAGITGLGDAGEAALADAGITTAADFLGCTTEPATVAGGAPRTVFRLRKGTYVVVPGIDPAAAARLEEWRRNLSLTATAGLSTELTRDRVAGIRTKYRLEIQALDEELRLAQLDAPRHRGRPAEITESERDRAPSKDRGSGLANSSESHRFDARITEAARRLADAEEQHSRVARELAPFAHITLSRYLARGFRR